VPVGIGIALIRRYAQALPAGSAVRGDMPERLLQWAAGLLSARRAEWGQAMLGELDHIDGRGRRWRFAAAPARRWPLARATAGSGGCLIIAAAAVWLAALADPGPPAPTPYHFLAPPCLLIAFSAVLAALGFLVYGVGTSWEQRRSRRQLPPPPGPGGHALQAGQRGGTGHDGVPPGPRTDQTRADLRVHKSRQRIPARAGRAPRGVRPAPGVV
jgi:hypothetical protein